MGSEGQPLLSPDAMTLFDAISVDGMAFLTHLLISVHESFTFPSDSHDRFRIRILFSPGANNGKELDVMEAVHLTPPEGLPLSKVAGFFGDVLCGHELKPRSGSKGYRSHNLEEPLEAKAGEVTREAVSMEDILDRSLSP